MAQKTNRYMVCNPLLARVTEIFFAVKRGFPETRNVPLPARYTGQMCLLAMGA